MPDGRAPLARAGHGRFSTGESSHQPGTVAMVSAGVAAQDVLVRLAGLGETTARYSGKKRSGRTGSLHGYWNGPGLRPHPVLLGQPRRQLTSAGSSELTRMGSCLLCSRRPGASG
jgi:hypothetical protein